MNTQTLYGYLFLLAGVFQLVTAFLVYRGNPHYILKLAGRKVGVIVYLVLAILLFYLAYRNLR
ncbi:hypothetical protein COR50_15765 [Chitinophaga caeni]|uniref:Uncharacterized protein n=1 Tax=Chitinophaga caeni TaxID=2029983 RepID=A0A291QWU4_9BACT|nr:hypothetical protein COR50_15765 [Chitinophaga caeni]